MKSQTKEWLARYYKIPAKNFKKKPRTRLQVIRALDHAINKWEGLRKKTLQHFGLRRDDREISERDDEWGKSILQIDSSTCSLCNMFQRTEGYCGDCPLGETLRTDLNEWCREAYSQFIDWGRVDPMLRRLINARKRLLSNPE